MDSALNPREIQTRIRAGESVDQVARAAGVPSEQVEAFATPVLAEREHQAAAALSSPVRRRGETGSHRSLSMVVGERLQSRGVDPDGVQWDAWRGENRIWTVQGRYQSDAGEQELLFHYDQRARFSTAANVEASALIGEGVPAQVPEPGRRRPGADPDAEPTVDLNDEQAMERAKADAGEMTVPLPHRPTARSRRPVVVEAAEEEPAPHFRDDEPASEPDGRPQTAAEPPVEDFLDTELEQVDGVYDFVPSSHSQLDTLYDMLSSFNEDSVNIYAGLSEPPAPEGDAAQVEPEPDEEPEPEPEPAEREVPRPRASERRRPGGVRPGTGQAADADAAQDALVDGPEGAPEATQQQKPKRRKRASVPTWDEIMFGGPRA